MSELDRWCQYPEAIHILSLGAGVQSSTLLFWADRGLVTPRPVAAIFADTQAEPASVYKWLDFLKREVSIPVYQVTQGDLAKKDLTTRRSKKSGNIYRSSMIPAFTLGTEKVSCNCVDEDEKSEKGCATCAGKGEVTRPRRGILTRRCTRDYKIYPIFKKAKELASVPRGCKETRVIQWIGISTDEVIRMKPSREPWAVNRWPLIEHGISRQKCLDWWAKEGLPTPPRSACVFCPYHNDNEWIRLKTQEPEEFAKAVKFERDMHKAQKKDETGSHQPFLHDSRVPLDQVKFEPKEKPKNEFNNECEGMCGA